MIMLKFVYDNKWINLVMLVMFYAANNKSCMIFIYPFWNLIFWVNVLHMFIYSYVTANFIDKIKILITLMLLIYIFIQLLFWQMSAGIFFHAQLLHFSSFNRTIFICASVHVVGILLSKTRSLGQITTKLVFAKPCRHSSSCSSDWISTKHGQNVCLSYILNKIEHRSSWVKNQVKSIFTQVSKNGP